MYASVPQFVFKSPIAFIDILRNFLYQVFFSHILIANPFIIAIPFITRLWTAQQTRHFTDCLKQVIIFITNFKQQFVRLHVSFFIIAISFNCCNIFFSLQNKSRIEKLKLIRAQAFPFAGLNQKSRKNAEIFISVSFSFAELFPIFFNFPVLNEFFKFNHLLIYHFSKFSFR